MFCTATYVIKLTSQEIMNCNQLFKLSLFFFVILTFTSSLISGKTCTSIQKKERIIHNKVRKPCEESYQARCHFLSLTYCTFKRPGYCTEESNETLTTYYRANICCKGYLKVQNGSCVAVNQLDPSVVDKLLKETSTETPGYNVIDNNDGSFEGTKSVDPHKKERIDSKDNTVLNLSHGTYAGIACALLFIIVIAVMAGIRIRKRQKKNLLKKGPKVTDQLPESVVLYDPSGQGEVTTENTETVT